MFSLDSAEITALQQPVIDSRNFVWFTVKDRDTGDPAYAGFWSDAGPFTGNVKDALTGSTVSRTFAGAGLVSVGSIPRTVGLAVRRVEVVLSAIDATAGGAFASDPTSYTYAKFGADGLTKVALGDEAALAFP